MGMKYMTIVNEPPFLHVCSSGPVLGSRMMASSIDLFGLYANCSESWREVGADDGI